MPVPSLIGVRLRWLSPQYEPINHQWLLPLIVGVGYLLTLPIINDLSRALEWDEAVYLSSAILDRPFIGYGPHRARGIIIAALPANLLDPSITAIRLWMAMLHSAALGFTVWVWQYVNRRAAVGAGLFAATWLVLFYGVEVSPNLLTALLLLSSLGALLNWLRTDRRAWMWLGAGLMAGAIIMRPSDSSFWALGLLIGSLVVGELRRVVVPVAIGSIVGWLPWLIEAQVIFDGVFTRLRDAAETVGAGPTGSLGEHLEMLDGPLIGPDPSNAVSPVGLAWLVLLIVLALVSRYFADPTTRTSVTLLLTGAAAVVIPYVVLTGALAPRFLMPFYAALCMAASFIPFGWPGRSPRKVAAVAASLCLVAGFAWWHVMVARGQDEVQVRTREVSVMIAEELVQEVGGGPCWFGSQYGYPQIAFYSGCTGVRLTPDMKEVPPLLKKAIMDNDPVYAIFWGLPEEESAAAGWTSSQLRVRDGEPVVWLLRPPRTGG